MYSFDTYSGILIPPYFTFLQAPLRSRTVGFPESGSDRSIYLSRPSHRSEAQTLAHIHPYLQWFACENRPIFNGLVYPGTVSGSSQDPPRAQAPLPDQGVTSPGVMSMHYVGGHYPSFIAPMDSCDRPKPSCRLWFPWSAGLCRLLPAPAGGWPFPTLSPRIFPRMLGPIPRWSPGARTRFFPRDIGLPHIGTESAHLQFPHSDFRTGDFRGCSHSLMFRPPGLLATQVAPTVAYLNGTLGSQGFYVRAYSVRYLPEQRIC